MRGQNIVCIAKDWHEDPTSNNHVMRELARHNRVLWLSCLATRTPNLASGRDLGRIVRRIKGFVSGPKQVEDNLWVYTPLVLPLPHSPIAARINRLILRATIGTIVTSLRMRPFQLWTFLPNVADFVGHLGESLVVYYCVDEWSKFSYLDGQRVALAEQKLCIQADVVFATAQSLVDRRAAWNPNTFLSRHGVDWELFSRATDESAPIPADLASIRPPVLGFYGTVQDWVDLDLIEYLARRRPDWSIVLIGKVSVDVSRFSDLKNVHLLGRRPHSMLPDYSPEAQRADAPHEPDQVAGVPQRRPAGGIGGAARGRALPPALLDRPQLRRVRAGGGFGAGDRHAGAAAAP